MKVLLINGSPKKNGCTFTALKEVSTVLNQESIETEIVHLAGNPIRDCIGCNQCSQKACCAFNDDVVNEWLEKAKNADGFVFGSPVYYAHPAGQLLSVLDRMFYAGSQFFEHKPGAAIVSARRAGTTASLDVLNKYISYASMPIVSSTYWNMVHGTNPEDVKKDLEGLQTMRNIGKNMAWLLKSINIAKENGLLPPKVEKTNRTNFIR